VQKLQAMRLSQAAQIVREGVAETLSYMAYPREHWTRLRTNNMLERIMREIRRRTRVVRNLTDATTAHRWDEVGHARLPRHDVITGANQLQVILHQIGTDVHIFFRPPPERILLQESPGAGCKHSDTSQTTTRN
jgi:hypothetical protein